MVKRFDEPKEKITPEYLEIAKRGKIIEFIQFLGCLSPGLLRVCALYLAKCQVKKGYAYDKNTLKDYSDIEVKI